MRVRLFLALSNSKASINELIYYIHYINLIQMKARIISSRYDVSIKILKFLYVLIPHTYNLLFLTHTVNHDSGKFTRHFSYARSREIVLLDYFSRKWNEVSNVCTGTQVSLLNQLSHSPFKLRKLQIAKFFHLYYLLT